MIHEYLHEKRLKIIKCYLGNVVPDLDIGAGKSPKALVTLDVAPDLKPDIAADAHHLPIRAETAKSIICSHVIEHSGKPEMIMMEIRRVLARDGVAFFFLPNDDSRLWRKLEHFWSLYYAKFVSSTSSPDTHVGSFSPETFLDFADKFFQVLKLDRINFGMEIFALCRKQR